MENNTLNHHGILGMRWGVRRTKAQLRRARGPNGTRRVTKEQYEAEKAKAINSGDTKKVRAWQGHLSAAELKNAVERCKTIKALDELENGPKKSVLDRIEGAMDKVGQVNNIVNTGLGFYGTVAKINNTFNDKHQLPVIDGTSYVSKRDKAAKQEADAAKKESREAEKNEREAAQERREAKKARDIDKLNELIRKGEYDKIDKSYNDFDPSAVEAVKKAMSDKDSFMKTLNELKKKKEKKDDPK